MSMGVAAAAAACGGCGRLPPPALALMPAVAVVLAGGASHDARCAASLRRRSDALRALCRQRAARVVWGKKGQMDQGAAFSRVTCTHTSHIPSSVT